MYDSQSSLQKFQLFSFLYYFVLLITHTPQMFKRTFEFAFFCVRNHALHIWSPIHELLCLDNFHFYFRSLITGDTFMSAQRYIFAIDNVSLIRTTAWIAPFRTYLPLSGFLGITWLHKSLNYFHELYFFQDLM